MGLVSQPQENTKKTQRKIKETNKHENSCACCIMQVVVKKKGARELLLLWVLRMPCAFAILLTRSSTATLSLSLSLLSLIVASFATTQELGE
jgi:hypothetical protein